jgi:E3 ubiquitin-protein ligase TRIP12
MNVQHLLSSDRPRNEATDPTSGLSTSDHGANDELQDDEQDNRSNSEIDDPDLVKEHDGGMHVDFGDELDPEQASLHDKDDDDNNMDESEIAALRACEALFGSDRASTTARGVGGGSGGEPENSPLSLLTAASLMTSHLNSGALAAMGISGLRGLGGIMAGFTLNSRISFNPSSTSRLAALQELAKILAVSTEDTLAGYFQTDSFARELVAILRGESERTKCEDEEDEVALVAALTATGSSSSSFNHPSSGTDVEQMLLASRCLANLMEALPGSAHTVVHHGAVPALCTNLL